MKKSLWVIVCLTALAGFLLIRLLSPASVRATTGSLAALWHFDEGAGTSAFDSSGNGNLGTLMGTTTLPTFVPGKFETAINFDGVDDFVRAADSASLEPSSKITVEMWVNSSNPGANAYLLAKGANDCSSGTYALDIASSGPGDLFFDVLVGGGTFVRSPSAPHASVFDGNWHHVAGTYDGSAVHLFLDGVEQGTAVATSGALKYGLSTTNDLFIATYNAGGGCFLPYHGALDEVRIWNRALAASEILASAQAGLRALWHFDETSGTSTADSSGYGNTGTLNGGAAFTAGTPLANFGNSLSLDGTTGFVSVPNNSSVSPPHAITVEAWIRITDYGFYPSVASKGNVGNYLESYALFVDPGGALGFLVNSNGTSGGRGIVIAGGPITKSAWVHVAGTYDGSTVKVYVNGTQVGSAAQTGPINLTLNPVLIGKSDRTSTPSPYPDSFFNGMIDEVHIWARALSANEIKFLAGIDPSPACIVLPTSRCTGELVVPDEIDQELDNGSGGVVTSEWEYGGPANPRHAMGLAFMVANDPTGSVTIRPPSDGIAVPSCATDKGSTPGTPTFGGFDGCEIGIGGKSAFITGEQISVTVGKSTITLSKTLHIFINLSDSNKVGAEFEWQ